MYKLEFLNGPQKGHILVFDQSTVLVGRDDDCDLVLDDSEVSRRHALIEYTDGQAQVRDLGALNSLAVNGVDVREALLEHGDTLSFGMVKVRYKSTHKPQTVTWRRRSPLEWVAVGSIAAFVLAQAVFLTTTARSWRSEVDVALLTPTPTPPPTPTAIPSPEPPPTPETQLPGVTLPPGPKPTPVPRPTPTPVPTATPLPEATPTPMPGLEGAEPQELMRRARDLIRQGQLMNADRLLNQVQNLQSDHVEAATLRAELFGRRAMYPESIAQWQRVLALSAPGSAAHDKASREVSVMRRRLKLLSGDLSDFATPEPFPTPVPIPTTRTESTPQPRTTLPRVEEKRVEIGNVKIERYSESRHFDEMRMLNYSLRHISATDRVPAGTVRVQITFYERVNGEVVKAAVEAADTFQEVSEPLEKGNQLNLTAPYVVPKNSRRDGRSFYGVVIRASIGGRIQDVYAQPDSLRNL